MTDLALPCFTAAPASATELRGPGIVVVHEGTGVNAQLIRVAERLAREGYRVVAPDFFSRADGIDPGDFAAIVGSVTPEHLDSDVAAATEHLRADGATSIGITGFCMGGRFSYRAALQAERYGIAASVPFYGGGIAQDLGEPQCPTLLFFGGSDPYIPTADIEAVQAHHPDDVVVYPDATHGFMRDGSDSYAPVDSADAWSRMLHFFALHLR
jgi:carboxymethylenebutenolidase